MLLCDACAGDAKDGGGGNSRDFFAEDVYSREPASGNEVRKWFKAENVAPYYVYNPEDELD